jgi:hypothetical protein
LDAIVPPPLDTVRPNYLIQLSRDWRIPSKPRDPPPSASHGQQPCFPKHDLVLWGNATKLFFHYRRPHLPELMDCSLTHAMLLRRVDE